MDAGQQRVHKKQLMRTYQNNIGGGFLARIDAVVQEATRLQAKLISLQEVGEFTPPPNTKYGEDQFEIKSSRVSQVIDYLENRDLKARVIDANLSKKVLVRLH